MIWGLNPTILGCDGGQSLALDEGPIAKSSPVFQQDEMPWQVQCLKCLKQKAKMHTKTMKLVRYTDALERDNDKKLSVTARGALWQLIKRPSYLAKRDKMKLKTKQILDINCGL